MLFLLSSQNVFSYLESLGLCSSEEEEVGQAELKLAKNFNLLVNLSAGRKLLVKQERHNPQGKTIGEFQREWQVREFMQKFPELPLLPLISEVIHFDSERSIIIFNYLEHYWDLFEFYRKENLFPIPIAKAIGSALALIHRTTFNRTAYQNFFEHSHPINPANPVDSLVHGLARLGPDIFGKVSAEGLKFFVLYQRFESLGRAIADLNAHFTPCCLTHNDLKLNNILLHQDWQTLNAAVPASERQVRLIDWERANWGDPAFDLGGLLASYLQLWLGSLVVSKSIPIEEALSLAVTPLERLQPSLRELAQTYLRRFPEIVQQRPDFLRRSMQFSGVALIQQIQATIQHQKTFGNTEICSLQVAKSLLCYPEQAISTVFGMSESLLLSPDQAPAP